MFKIGEFSKLTQVSIRMLRYYDETGLLKPAEIDKWTGYRLYSVEQIPILNKIVYLRDSGFLISEIITALNKKDDPGLLAQLDKKYKEIEQNIQEEQERLRKINLAKAEILMGKRDIHYNISIKEIPSYQVLSLRRIIPDYYAEGTLWQELSAFAAEHQIPLSSNTFSIYHDTSYKETLVDVELCAPVERLGKSSENFVYRSTSPVPTMACTMVYGAFSNIRKGYLTFSNWLQENNRYQMSGPTRQIVHRGPWNENNPDNYLIELQIPFVQI
ncbi:MerR family transcriptional regulator [Aminipila butyrica]|uniref:MerR family transcriptional regulator n=1 Tax=Aminipila butyrica TaxID=433296 RepID=A0A858BVI3_9FIRM|nr:effector binding domain-containing protein [Aminipila butyrica]QIB70061.1 MerR family transcriptional regulator [Aminipila butyrica]